MNDNSGQFSYNCIKCGNCCRAGLEISIRKQDIINWKDRNKRDFLEHIQIDAKSISAEGLAGYHIEEKNALLALLNEKNIDIYEMKKEELRDFILKNHEFQGEGSLPLPIYSFILELGRMPVLIPKDFTTILEGINKNIDYVIKLDSNGSCPFLKKNECSIHEIKPFDCRSYPYDERGHIKLDKFFLKICPGIRKIDNF